VLGHRKWSYLDRDPFGVELGPLVPHGLVAPGSHLLYLGQQVRVLWIQKKPYPYSTSSDHMSQATQGPSSTPFPACRRPSPKTRRQAAACPSVPQQPHKGGSTCLRLEVLQPPLRRLVEAGPVVVQPGARHRVPGPHLTPPPHQDRHYRHPCGLIRAPTETSRIPPDDCTDMGIAFAARSFV
jgi:hypothetical protein